VSPQNLLERALMQEQEHAVILLDASARVIGWLPGATKTLGYTPEEMVGQTLEPIFTSEDLARGDLDWEIRSARSYGKSEDDRWQVRTGCPIGRGLSCAAKFASAIRIPPYYSARRLRTNPISTEQ
jgi:PAS domain-containing protein